MKVTQEQLDDPLKSLDGTTFSIDAQGSALTMRFALTEAILYADDKRSGADRLSGVKVAEKIHTRMGELEFDDAEVKLIEDRMDRAPLLTQNDYLYTLVRRFLRPTEAPNGI